MARNEAEIFSPLLRYASRDDRFGGGRRQGSLQHCDKSGPSGEYDEALAPATAGFPGFSGADPMSAALPLSSSLVVDALKISDYPLVAIVGPTASGKSALAVRLAAALGGEIVNFDSVPQRTGQARRRGG